MSVPRPVRLRFLVVPLPSQSAARRVLGSTATTSPTLNIATCGQPLSSFIGAMKIGAVPVPMNTAARQPELELMLEDSRARALVVDEGLVGGVGRCVPRRFVAGTSLDADLERASPHLEAFPTGVDEPCY